ncbi:MAG: M48 family metallopeptidase [Bacteroidaceae bacterium]|nr:M48 family metallopeptidase [Bacteroidaceae bacterium]
MKGRMQYQDKDFGTIHITVNPRARRIIMRPVVGGLRVTVPPYRSLTLGEVKEVIDNHRSALLRNWHKVNERPVTSDEELKYLRKAAKQYLPIRLAELAQQFNFHYTGLKIQSSRTRWGSCSGTNSINLSLFLMRVPEHLIDYVILHELCHTVHHDHSDRFWALMDEVTGGKAKELRKQLANYTTA